MLRSGGTSTPHDHAVSFYADDADVVAQVGAWVHDGLAAGARVVVVATPGHRAAVDEYLLKAGVDAPGERARGRYVCRDAAQTLSAFMCDGHPDPMRFQATVGDLVEGVTQGGSPVLVFGEMVALLWQDGYVGAALALELLWNTLAESRVFTLICAYPASVLDGGSLTDLDQVCALHSTVRPPRRCSPSPVSPWSLDPCAPRQRSEVFIPAPEAAGAARRFAATVLQEWGRTDLTEDVTLVISELATNAVRHARSPFLVFVHDNPGDALFVGVKDVDPDPPLPKTPTSSKTYGRGLLIVDALAHHWGCHSLPDGKLVWAEFNAR